MENHLSMQKLKLIKKTDDTYILSHNPSGWCIGSTDYEYISKHKGEQIVSKLSKQNCDEIFGVTDVEKLTNEEIPASSHTNYYVQRMRFIQGFNKAMELNKDKVFTLEDIKKAIVWAHDKSTEGVYLSRLPVDEFIQSLQQPTEIEVEIVTRPASLVYKSNLVIEELDSEGCLILKKI